MAMNLALLSYICCSGCCRAGKNCTSNKRQAAQQPQHEQAVLGWTSRTHIVTDAHLDLGSAAQQLPAVELFVQSLLQHV
jgi:hypothetical protein